MSGFKYKDKDAFYPPGSIIQYMGTTEPDGWIICDGTSRSNTDGRYNRLITLNIGTSGGANTTYIPISLVNKFLMSSANTFSINSTGGAETVILQTNNLPSHSHNMQHMHYVAGRYNESGSINGYGTTNSGLYTGLSTKVGSSGTYEQQNGVHLSAPYDYFVGNVNSEKNDTGATGDGTSFSIMPSYCVVYHIMKY
jgi:microcystin-dependent protein